MATPGSGGSSLWRTWADLSVRAKGALVVAIPLLCLLIGSLSFAQGQTQERLARERLAEALDAVEEIDGALVLTVDAETGARGFLLTGDPGFLAPYDLAIARADEVVSALRKIARPGQEDAIGRVTELIDERLAILSELVAQARLGTIRNDLLRDGRVVQEELRTRLEGLRSQTDREIAAARATAEMEASDARTRTVVFLVIGMIGGVGAVLLFGTGIVTRLGKLESYAAAVNEGHPGAAPVSGADEIGRLARAFEAGSTMLRQKQDQLLEARAFLEGLIASAPVLMFGFAGDDHPTYVSSNADRLLGRAAAELQSQDGWWGAVHPMDRAALRAAIGSVANGARAITDGEFRFLHPRSGVRTLVVTISSGGAGGSLLGYAVDVSETRIARTDLSAREAQLSAILGATPDVIATIAPDGTVLYVSAAVVDILGHPTERFLAGGFGGVLDDQDLDAWELALSAARSSDEGGRCRVRMLSIGDVALWFDVRIRKIPGGSGAVVVVGREISSQVELEEALERAKDRAESSNRAKSEFLSRMSHELRTPLNVILGFGQVLEMLGLSEQQKDPVDHMLKAGRHLLDLINEVLDLSRIEAGRISISPEPVALSDAIGECMELLGPFAEAEQVTLHSEALADFPHRVKADKQRLKQVCLNLLNNAIKYNRAGGTVEISAVLRPDRRVRVSVRDTGPGIAAGDLNRLFDPFERLAAEHGSIEGTGLGLALSKRLIELMGGELGVESSSGEGSTFWVELALAEELDAPDAADRISTEIPDLHGLRVLHIEDNDSNVTLIRRVLDLVPGSELIEAREGLAAIRMARDDPPDVVLLDLHLGDVSGEEVLRRLKMDPATGSIPVVVLSADATPARIASLLERGAADYLTKPLDIARLFALLGTLTRAGESSGPGNVS